MTLLQSSKVSSVKVNTVKAHFILLVFQSRDNGQIKLSKSVISQPWVKPKEIAHTMGQSSEGARQLLLRIPPLLPLNLPSQAITLIGQHILGGFGGNFTNFYGYTAIFNLQDDLFDDIVRLIQVGIVLIF
ncbi:MAG: hypothetical protein ACI83L_002050 [Cryomorphaceae bacterium]|jgi:hypothetical protein